MVYNRDNRRREEQEKHQTPLQGEKLKDLTNAYAIIANGGKKIKPVDKIVGPGNAYVSAAQRYVSGDIGIPSLTAGPSEVLIVADKNSNPEWVASDLIGQAEHDNLAQCILISKVKYIVVKVKIEIFKQLKKFPRQSVAKISLISNGILMHISSDKKIIETVRKTMSQTSS